MAIMDALARFSYKHDVNALVADTRSGHGDTYDLRAGTYAVFPNTGTDRDIGDSAMPIYINWIVDTLFNQGSTGTIRFGLWHASAIGSSGSLTSSEELVSRTFTNDVAAGTQFSIFIPVGTKVKRYIQPGLVASAAVTDANSGALTTWIDIKAVETRIIYPEGRNWV